MRVATRNETENIPNNITSSGTSTLISSKTTSYLAFTRLYQQGMTELSGKLSSIHPLLPIPQGIILTSITGSLFPTGNSNHILIVLQMPQFVLQKALGINSRHGQEVVQPLCLFAKLLFPFPPFSPRKQVCEQSDLMQHFSSGFLSQHAPEVKLLTISLQLLVPRHSSHWQSTIWQQFSLMISVLLIMVHSVLVYSLCSFTSGYNIPNIKPTSIAMKMTENILPSSTIGKIP